MKTVVFSLVFLLVGLAAQAQDTSDLVQVGDIMIIGQAENGTFEHIHFPRKNFIIKRGGIANMKSVYGNSVVVRNVNPMGDGSTEVVLARKDGRKFFRHLSYVTADLEKALAKGELKTTKGTMKNELAKS